MKRAICTGMWLFVAIAWLPAQSQKTQPQKKTEPFWAKVLRIAGVSTTPASLRGDDQVTRGDIWWVTVTEKAVPQRLTRGGGYYAPVFDASGQTVLTLQGSDLYRVSLSGDPPVKLHTVVGVTKLVGVSRDDPDQVLVVGEDIQQHLPFAALLSIQSGRLVVIPHNPDSSEDHVMLAHISGWERIYGDTRVYPEKNEREGPGGTTLEFRDVYLQRGSDPPINLTNGNRLSSSQPSLSGDGQKVVFIREER
jgi:hypothetical protein